MEPERPVVEFEYPDVGTISIVGESPTEYIFSLIRSTGVFYESDLLALLDHIGLPKGGVVVDVGAHIGNHSVYFTKVLGLRTHAVEPRRKNYELLVENARANGVEDMVVGHNMAAGAHAGTARLEQWEEGNSGAFLTVPDPSGAVEVRRLDELIPVDEQVVLVKIDVEGNEVSVLEGAKGLLHRWHPVVTVEAHSGTALDRLARLLGEYTYEPIGVEGRSDNYVFASRSQEAVVSFEQVEERTALYRARRRDQLLQSLGSHLTRSLTTREEAMVEAVKSEIKSVREELSGPMQSLQQELRDVKAEADEAKNAASRLEHEIRRIHRSRPWRILNGIRRGLGRMRLASDFEILDPDELMSRIDTQFEEHQDEAE